MELPSGRTSKVTVARPFRSIGPVDSRKVSGTDAGVLSEARPVEATRPARLACGFEATPGGGAFYGKTYSFDALSLTARSSFDSFDASSARSMLFASSASNDCECTDTLAHNVVEAALMCSPERHTATHARWVQTSTYREVR